MKLAGKAVIAQNEFVRIIAVVMEFARLKEYANVKMTGKALIVVREIVDQVV